MRASRDLVVKVPQAPCKILLVSSDWNTLVLASHRGACWVDTIKIHSDIEHMGTISFPKRAASVSKCGRRVGQTAHRIGSKVTEPA